MLIATFFSPELIEAPISFVEKFYLRAHGLMIINGGSITDLRYVEVILLEQCCGICTILSYSSVKQLFKEKQGFSLRKK